MREKESERAMTKKEKAELEAVARERAAENLVWSKYTKAELDELAKSWARTDTLTTLMNFRKTMINYMILRWMQFDHNTVDVEYTAYANRLQVVHTAITCYSPIDDTI